MAKKASDSISAVVVVYMQRGPAGFSAAQGTSALLGHEQSCVLFQANAVLPTKHSFPFGALVFSPRTIAFSVLGRSFWMFSYPPGIILSLSGFEDRILFLQLFLITRSAETSSLMLPHGMARS